MFTWNDGDTLDESLIAIAIEQDGDNTEVVLTHYNLPDQETIPNYEAGGQSSFE